jgi:hypothetical protein
MSHNPRPAPQSNARVFAVPLLLALVSLTGLIIGLTGEGWRDALAAILLFIPVALFVRHWLIRR